MTKVRTKDVTLGTPAGNFDFYNPSTLEELVPGDNVIYINKKEGDGFMMIPFQTLNEETFEHCIKAVVYNEYGVSAVFYKVIDNSNGVMVLQPYFERDGTELVINRYGSVEKSTAIN